MSRRSASPGVSARVMCTVCLVPTRRRWSWPSIVAVRVMPAPPPAKAGVVPAAVAASVGARLSPTASSNRKVRMLPDMGSAALRYVWRAVSSH